MENQTYEQLEYVCKTISQQLKDLDVENLDPTGDAEKWETVLSLNDDFGRYIKRLLYLQGKRRERESLYPAVKNNDKRRKDTGLYLITLSPPPESQNRMFIEAVHQFVKLSVVEEAKYCFEQRGVVEGEYPGIHAHILCQRRAKPYAFRKELSRVFDKFFRENFSEKQKNVENVEIVEKSKVIRYLRGEKNGRKSDKSKKVENDKLFRRDWKLKDLYEVTRA